MSKVTKNGFSHFRRRFEAFHKPRVPTGFDKIGHILQNLIRLEI